MRKLHIKSENREVFLDNLKEIMISRGISNLSVKTEKFTQIFSELIGMLNGKNLIIEGYYERKNFRGILIGTKDRRLLIKCGDGLKLTEVSDNSTYFDHLNLIEVITESPESVNFLDT